MDSSSSQSNDELVHVAHQLVCLRNVIGLLSDNTTQIKEILHSFLHLIPEAWQFPDIVCVKLEIGKEILTSVNYQHSQCHLESEIKISEVSIGKLTVSYLEEFPDQDEGPFLKQERDMIETLANELARFIERRQLLESKEQQHRELTLYSSLLRHDIKNDLGIILANIDLLQMILIDSEDEVKETIQSSEAACNRILTLLNSFKRNSEVVEQNLYQLISRVSRQAQDIHEGLTVDVYAPETLDCLFIPKSNLLPLVFENLLRNAAIHAGDSCRVTIELNCRDEEVFLRFSDNGPGIAKEIRPRLFQKGVSTRGGGLGLYLSRQVIETIGGSIELVVDEFLEGAVFDIKLPKAIASERRIYND